jgi:site-specific DNA recombinase
LFEAAAHRIKARSDVPPPKMKRARHLLSGLLKCGACSAGMSVYGGTTRDKRICCTRHAESRTCPDPHTFRLASVEEAVLGALRAELRHPTAIAEFVRTYHEERRKLASQDGARRTGAERRLNEIRREIDRIVEGVARGELASGIFGPKATALDEERKKLEEDLSATEPDFVVALHPAVLARYEGLLGRLQQSIAAGIAGGNSEYTEVIRELVESVTVRQGKGWGKIEVEILGRLNALLGQGSTRQNVSGVMVAGAGFEPATSGL